MPEQECCGECFHVVLCMGARVRIYEGKVTVLSEPVVRECPYMRREYGVTRADKSVVKRVIEEKIRRYGLFTPRRRLVFDRVVLFGSSEIISWCVENGLLDAAVIVCDGAGTIIASNPRLIQGVGARMNGVLRTCPIREVISRVEGMGGIVLDPLSARIDQVRGGRRAVEEGYKRIAVTVIGPMAHEIHEIRRLEEKLGVDVTVFSTCNTLASPRDQCALEKADYVCTSASAWIRRSLGPRALLQLGVSIPVLIMTGKCKRLILEYLRGVDEQVLVRRARLPFETPSTPVSVLEQGEENQCEKQE